MLQEKEESKKNEDTINTLLAYLLLFNTFK